MKKLFSRGAIVALAAAGLIATMAPPASAITAGVVVFVGNANTPPLGYPPAPGQNGGVGFTSNPGQCVGAGVNVTKAGKAPAEAGACSVAAGGSITGLLPGGAVCGQSYGQVSGTANTPSGQPVQFTANFVTAASVVVVTGTSTLPPIPPLTGPAPGGAQKGSQTGPIVGAGLAIPPTPVVTPGQSCLTNNATTFTVVMAAAFVVA